MLSSPAVAAASSGHAWPRGDEGRFPISVWHATLLFVVLTAVMTWSQVWHPLSVPDHPDYESRFSYNSTFHWRPLVNGYSGFRPLSYVELLGAAKDFPSDDSLDALSARGVEYLILYERFYGPEGYRRATRALDGRGDLTGFGPFAEGSFEVRAYRMPPRSSGTGAAGR